MEQRDSKERIEDACGNSHGGRRKKKKEKTLDLPKKEAGTLFPDQGLHD